MVEMKKNLNGEDLNSGNRAGQT